MKNENQIRYEGAKHFDSMEKIMSNLYARWQNEKDYEDFAEYVEVIKKNAIKNGAKFIKAGRRPFGYVWEMNDRTYQTEVSAKTIGYKRIK